MKGFLIPGVLAAAVLIAIAAIRFIPTCDAGSPPGPKIGGVILIAGCR